MNTSEKKSFSVSEFRSADSSNIPVPSRFQLIELLEFSEYPLRLQQICSYFELKEQQDIASAVDSRLRRLCGSGILHLDRKGRYGLAKKMDLVVGRVVGHANGFGFVIPDEGGDDLYLHHRQMRKVLHGDRVLARVSGIDKRGKKEGTIVEVLVEVGREIIGRYHVSVEAGFLEPDDARFSREISIPKKHANKAKDADIVIVEIIVHPVERGHAVGKVTEIVGKELAPGMETEIALRKHSIPHAWPNSVEQYLKDEKRRFIASKPGVNRQDLRSIPLVTIDGEDAKDFDDAVYCQTNSQGWRLMVAIADVSDYVKVGNELDLEAYNRGTSVYFPNRVVPMLPEELSNGICSLMPNVDRNCFVCDMQINKQGKVSGGEFYQAVMHSHARLTYNQVNRLVVEKDREKRKAMGGLLECLDELYSLSKCLRRSRKKLGSIDFELPEAMILFNDQGKIDNIVPRERNDAHKLVEECMLAANVCAGEFIQQKLGEQGLYRNHEGPDQEGLVDVRKFIAGFSLKLGGGNTPSASNYATLLNSIKDRPEVKNVVQAVLLRSLSQAIYSPEELGHFALSFPIYTHFTSPIRRYSDLVVHRLIKKLIGIKGYSKSSPEESGMGKVGEQCSFTERRADDASRDVLGWLKAEFMSEKVGETFQGTISGVKEFGIFVQLDEVLVDGLVHVTNLGSDYYHYDSTQLELVGKRSGHRFKLGDKVSVIVSSVNMEQSKIDFELVKAQTPKSVHDAHSTEPRKRKKKKRSEKMKRKPISKKNKGIRKNG